MKRISVDKFSSTTLNIPLQNPIRVEATTAVNVGDIVIVEALTENPNYPNIELVNGELSPVKKGDVIAGVIGTRQALRGFVGYAPFKINSQDELSILNMGGVIGRYISGAPGLGEPIKVKYLGIAKLGSKLVNMKDYAIRPSPFLANSKPIILIVGSCMNVGKTVCATSIVKRFSDAGYKVASAKLSGVAALKDLMKMKDAGAIKTLSFIDAGFPSTIDAIDFTDCINGIINALTNENPDLIVAELGDGILGHYNVDSVLLNRNFMERVVGLCLCATDLVAVYGARQILTELGVNINCISGPVTDTTAGTSYIESQFNIPACNTFTEGDKLFEILHKEYQRCLKNV